MTQQYTEKQISPRKEYLIWFYIATGLGVVLWLINRGTLDNIFSTISLKTLLLQLVFTYFVFLHIFGLIYVLGKIPILRLSEWNETWGFLLSIFIAFAGGLIGMINLSWFGQIVGNMLFAEFDFHFDIIGFIIIFGIVTGIGAYIISYNTMKLNLENSYRILFEQERVKRELEEARKLQLSMLPKEIPDLPGIEIAVHMETATEVGGDYYDFHIDEDGTLTIAVGDATGHGAKAGMMVTVAKSLFHQLAGEDDIRIIFHKFTESIKKLNFDQLYMGLKVAKFKNGTLNISAAGMPPAYVYRAASGKVEEIRMRGMPLGSFSDFPYEQRSITISSGDTILLMSDGFPESFNEKKEILDYPRVLKYLSDIGNNSPDDILHYLIQKGNEWMNEAPQEDDITFVVVKIK